MICEAKMNSVNNKSLQAYNSGLVNTPWEKAKCDGEIICHLVGLRHKFFKKIAHFSQLPDLIVIL